MIEEGPVKMREVIRGQVREVIKGPEREVGKGLEREVIKGLEREVIRLREVITLGREVVLEIREIKTVGVTTEKKLTLEIIEEAPPGKKTAIAVSSENRAAPLI